MTSPADRERRTAYGDPSWFGPEQRPLAGVLHMPAREAARDVGVVLCKPFGVDLVCTHRAHRHLASDLAHGGFPTLRFDYDGTGDSAGNDEDPARFEAWLESIGRAIVELRAQAPVERICLVGAGIGALLATAFVGRGGDGATPSAQVDSLVLFGPAVSGRTWLRQARAFQLLKAPKDKTTPGGSPSPHAPDEEAGEEIVGFRLTKETVEALGGLEPLAPGVRGPREALIIPRDDLPGGEERLAQRLRAAGTDVTVTAAPGFGAMMRDDPYTSVVPDQAWHTIVEWLAARSSVRGLATRVGEPLHRASSLVEPEKGAPLVRETFAPLGGLFAVATEPADRSTLGTTIFLLNIGANPHYGANRMYVEMARAWAGGGLRAVRLDLAGLGDTPAAPGDHENHIYAPGVVGEVRAAMDADARAHGTKRFILVGLCSGAYSAFHVGVADERVAHIVLINPLTFHWREGDSLEVRTRQSVKSRQFYARAALQGGTWKRILRGEVHVRAVATALASRAITAGVRAFYPGDVERGFRALDRRGTRMLVVLGIEDAGVDLVEANLGPGARRMRRAKHFSMVVLDGPDHTFTSVRWQRHLSELLARHLAGRSSGPGETRSGLLSGWR